MESYIENKTILYFMAALYLTAFMISIGRRWIFGVLASEAGKMASTRNRLLKHIKLKYENAFRLEKNVHNVEIFVEKHLIYKKYCGISLYRLPYVMSTCKWMGVWLGLYVIWYEYYKHASFQNKYIMIYGMGSVMMWLSLEIIENLLATEYVQKKAVLSISNYLDNHLRNQLEPAADRFHIPPSANKQETSGTALENANPLDASRLSETEWTNDKIIEDILKEFFC